MDVPEALADPIRREILERLHVGALPAGAIAEAFAVSRPAVSRHLRVLLSADLVRVRVVGRERHYELHPEALTDFAAWIARLRTAPVRTDRWDRLFDALDTEVARARRDRRTGEADAATQRHRDSHPGTTPPARGASA